MKKYFSIILVLLLVVLGVGFLTYSQSFQDKEIETPLPEFLTQKDNDQVSSLDFWLPSIMGFFDSNYHLGLNWYRSLFPTFFSKWIIRRNKKACSKTQYK